jgi:hypothetical protein
MRINKLIEFYNNNIEEHSHTLKKLKRKIYHTGTLRLIIIAAMIICLWLLRSHNILILIITCIAFLALFLALIVFHSRLYAKRTFEEGIIRFNENEKNALNYDYSAFDGANNEIDVQHSFSYDLDMFGDNSIFQSVNRTSTPYGKEKLISWFKAPLDVKEKIIKRQVAVIELSKETPFRHNFYVTGENTLNEKKDIYSIFDTENNKNSLSDNLFLKILLWTVPSIWVILIVCTSFNLISPGFIGIYIGVCLALTSIPARKIHKAYVAADKTESVFKSYSNLMLLVEKNSFTSDILVQSRDVLLKNEVIGKEENITASDAIKRLSKIISALDQRFSIVGVTLNLLYMRDVHQSIKLEQWKNTFSGKFKDWFDALSVFDALNSLGSFAFNHPGYIYPSITNTYFEMRGEELGHPLIHRDKCVCNDLIVPKDRFFIVITGANMAGKSTFLRTVGVNFLLATIGAPVFAKSLSLNPAHLVTSLRTSDSLITNESYFFAELKRLKMIIDRLNSGEKLFIILDEILKGTNSIDKQKGSLALVRQLISKATCGIIATHDLLLGSLADSFPNNVINKRFEAEIENDELHFSYKMQNGVAKNMNASFLIKKMGIADDL